MGFAILVASSRIKQSIYSSLTSPSTHNIPSRKKHGLDKRHTHLLTQVELDLRKLRQMITLVASQKITLEAAVQEIVDLAKDKSHDEIYSPFERVWWKTIIVSRVSRQSAHNIVDFLVFLSKQSQRDACGRMERTWGHRLWRNMPMPGTRINDFWNNSEVPKTGSVRKTAVTRFHQDVYFTLMLSRSCRPNLDYCNQFLLWTFNYGLDDSDGSVVGREDLDIYIPAMMIQMDPVGPDLIDTISSGPEITIQERFTLRKWRYWQHRLLEIAADETTDNKLRQIAVWTSEKMPLKHARRNHQVNAYLRQSDSKDEHECIHRKGIEISEKREHL